MNTYLFSKSKGSLMKPLNNSMCIVSKHDTDRIRFLILIMDVENMIHKKCLTYDASIFTDNKCLLKRRKI